MRTVAEWVGKTDNSMPPATVRQRILERANYKCWVCGGEIDKPGWHADHVPPLKDGGENRESKIHPAHEICHRKLTAQQAIDRAPIERQKMKHTGAVRPKQSIPSPPKSEKPAPKAHASPRRSLYAPRPQP